MKHLHLSQTPVALRKLFFTCQLLLLALLPPTALALDWPQEVSAPEGKIIVYQPQPEKFSGNQLTGRSAMAILPTGSDEQIFGTFWFEARVDTDRDSDTAIVRDLKVLEVRWPDSGDANEQRFTAIVESALPATGFEISMERLAASLATAEMELKSLDELNNDPPAIVFREQLAVLLMYDGEPRYSPIENSDYERVLNAPIVVVRDKRGHHYVTNGKLWYESGTAMGPWKITTSPPADLAKAMPAPAEDTPDWDTPPEIVVASEPTELIVTDGAPEWTPLAGGEVLYVSNTESPWLRDLPTGNMYVLLSGRWFRAKKTTGPWTFVPADELPSAFSDIPPASDIGGLRTSVAGTPEAEEAVLDAQIPQTAAISRADAKLEVSYDGSPKFEQIKGTGVSYAVNTATQVLKIDGDYYAVDNGVWFSSAKPTGPWIVADEIPKEEIAKIPPSSPVYNTTHVTIYESTPEVVYVGYTPGYLWSFPYYGVPVYGSGWYYRPYPGPWYYPRPPTWGFNVGYNPWTGWNYGVSWSNGFLSFGVSFGGGYNHYRGCCGSGWYGGGFRGPTIINTGDINIGNNVNVGNRTNIGNKLASDNKQFKRDMQQRENLYNRPGNKDRKADSATVKGDFKRAQASHDRKNNVYADRDGKLARNVDNQWETLDKGNWKKNDDLNRPATHDSREKINQQQRPQSKPASRPTSRPSTRQHDLDRARHSRNTGAQHERARQAPHRSMPSHNRRR